MGTGHVVMGLLFYPRGGSACVVRYLSPALARAGWSVSLAVGSLGEPGEETSAPTFFAGLDVHILDSTDAVRAFEAGGDPIAAPAPMHPSYEDRAGVPDVLFASVPPELAAHLAAVWEEPFRAAGADHADLFHLHHLTPQLDAVHANWPDVPLVVHLHGTEMKMIEAIKARAALASGLGETLATMPEAVGELEVAPGALNAEQTEMLRTTRWDAWRQGEFWAAHLKEQVHLADHLIVVSPQNRETAISLFGLEPERVTALPNGVDIERFRPRSRLPGGRRDAFRRFLVDDPQGWTEHGPPGTLAYTEADLDRLLGEDDDATVLLFVGRFLGFKRVPALIRAFARARDEFNRRGSLVIWGGHPGEWEDEHPVTVAEEVGSDGIFFAGWRGHDDLPSGLAAADVLVVPSVDDPYPQVPLEAMAVGLPVVACASGGLLSMVNLDPDRPTGWFVPNDDLDALTDALTTVVNNPEETARRGANALAHARAELSWDGLVTRFEKVYAQAAAYAARRQQGGDRVDPARGNMTGSDAPRALRFAIIGAGMAGILSAIKLSEAGLTDYTIYEKGDRFGGTWRENTYPGLACDVPSHLYSYSFALTPEWSHQFSPGPEIQSYFERVAHEHDLERRVRFGDEVTRCEFTDGRWQLETAAGHRDEVDVVIAATGVLHHPRLPDIEGLDSFAGAQFHSSRWDHDVELEGARVGIIGTGSTAVQMVGAIVDEVAHLSLFQRTPQWVLPQVNPEITEDEKAAYRDEPERLVELHSSLSQAFGVFANAVVDAESPEMHWIEAACKTNLEENVADPELRERLRPEYRAACKRLIISPNFYEAIQAPNAELVTEAIECVVPEGVRTKDGELHELDVLVLATGFHADAFMRPMAVIGRAGHTLAEEWADRPNAYLSISIPDFPNFFMLNGPNGPVGNFSLIEVAELQFAYVMQLVERLRSGECREVSATRSAMDEFEAARVEAAKKTVWVTGCRSWYLDDRGIPATWPWAFDKFRAEMQAPDPGSFEYR